VKLRALIPVVRHIPTTERLPANWLPESLPIDVPCLEHPTPSPAMRDESRAATVRIGLRGLS
jgi:hypothetical protein